MDRSVYGPYLLLLEPEQLAVLAMHRCGGMCDELAGESLRCGSCCSRWNSSGAIAGGTAVEL